MDKISLIRFNDDNHAERIFINGVYVGDLSDVGEVIKNTIDITRDLNDDNKFEETGIYVCDDFEDYDEDDEMVETIWDFFNYTDKITEKQIELINERNWEELYKII